MSFAFDGQTSASKPTSAPHQNLNGIVDNGIMKYQVFGAGAPATLEPLLSVLFLNCWILLL